MVKFTIVAGAYDALLSMSTFLFDSSAHSIQLLDQFPGGTKNLWVTRHPTNTSVFYAIKNATVNDEDGSEILSFVVDKAGTMNLIDRANSRGEDAVYVGVTDAGRGLAVVNFSSGTAVSVPLQADNVTFGTTNGPTATFMGSGPDPRQPASRPHEIVQYGDELFVPDLGADKIWRISRSEENTVWNVSGFIQQPIGSGPRHIVAKDGVIYALHELINTVTAQTIPPVGSSTAPKLLASFTTLPGDVAPGSEHGVAEIMMPPTSREFPEELLYISNRNTSPDPTLRDPRGDTIAIFATKPTLRLVRQFYTGLQQLRGVAVGGDRNQYIVAAGQVDGGMAVFERIDQGRNLRAVARYQGEGAVQLVTFAWM
ncbi:Lactonase, 7-bladed beta-propeller-domain-containing protein [Collybia nuda]|uniref:Lactonase, 7-bladed beta-propeller-domain-containing protein n=1 Tax=Collybia nuda TaxID=64659 RepID=A0A9P6CKI6_9AGAR|nr:Lactonase, 7-bladed beta-propeller-domain-containing protein [Collybia nuda]